MGEIRKYGSHKYWTEEEEKQLRRLSKKKTSLQIAKIMGRTKSSVDCKRKRMMIPDCINATDKIIAKQVGYLVGQHEKSIYNRWKKAGLPIKPFGANYYVISEEELVDFMKEHHELWRASQCDYDFFGKYDWFLKRLEKERNGTDTINHYRNRRNWTSYELSKAKMMWERGKTALEIAKELDRSTMAIYHKINEFKGKGKNE